LVGYFKEVMVWTKILFLAKNYYDIIQYILIGCHFSKEVLSKVKSLSGGCGMDNSLEISLKNCLMTHRWQLIKPSMTMCLAIWLNNNEMALQDQSFAPSLNFFYKIQYVYEGIKFPIKATSLR
jgi:hypothetical protein